MNFINFTELNGLASEGFDKTEIISEGSITTIYGGKANATDPATADSREDWKIRRVVITENGGTTDIVRTWAEGSWGNRASLTYKYL